MIVLLNMYTLQFLKWIMLNPSLILPRYQTTEMTNERKDLSLSQPQFKHLSSVILMNTQTEDFEAALYIMDCLLNVTWNWFEE